MPLDCTGADALDAEIARLRGLDLPGLQARWKALTGRKAPPHLSKHLLLRMLAYRVQADAWGDLDKATIRFLERLAAGGWAADAPVPLPARRALSPGTLLRREWQGVLHQVEVGEGGFSWNGATYRSLSEVARAITGTRWNGPRFFGLREGA
ncbi:DUF2924 domain-containing protein [Methylobacterium frigidaeris]|uniref:DUF2924 domain-containing protein n=1 Tax=Methylobacterium frigidaeris TaxID=2038277 RepID=A0AA37HJM2_9HYPH|nr:DUF2924 domain-containing protein [Methylobacterium frigidaeris]GJD66814.1 hypothetical protein MPEAHAMD_7013 [Methylobacterium frigidaeris]